MWPLIVDIDQSLMYALGLTDLLQTDGLLSYQLTSVFAMTKNARLHESHLISSNVTGIVFTKSTLAVITENAN